MCVGGGGIPRLSSRSSLDILSQAPPCLRFVQTHRICSSSFTTCGQSSADAPAALIDRLTQCWFSSDSASARPLDSLVGLRAVKRFDPDNRKSGGGDERGRRRSVRVTAIGAATPRCLVVGLAGRVTSLGGFVHQSPPLQNLRRQHQHHWKAGAWHEHTNTAKREPNEKEYAGKNFLYPGIAATCTPTPSTQGKGYNRGNLCFYGNEQHNQQVARMRYEGVPPISTEGVCPSSANKSKPTR